MDNKEINKNLNDLSLRIEELGSDLKVAIQQLYELNKDVKKLKQMVGWVSTVQKDTQK